MEWFVSEKRTRYVTEEKFDRHMAAIARSFAGVDERLNRLEAAMETLFKEVRSMREEAKEDRQTLRALAYNDLKQDNALEELHRRMIRCEARR